MLKLKFFRVLFYQIRSVAAWLPVIWDNYYDYDFGSFVDITIFKLERMEKVLRAEPWHEGSEQRADEIKEAVRLLRLYREGIPVPPEAEFWLEDVPGSPYKAYRSNAAMKDWGKESRRVEEESRQQAWGLIAKNARGWWC